MSEVGFIIPSFCKTEEDLKVCKFCIDSIRKFYPNNKIIIIDDYSYINIKMHLKIIKILTLFYL